MRNQMQNRVDLLVKDFMKSLQSAVAANIDGLNELMMEAMPKKTPAKNGKLSQPSDNGQAKGNVKRGRQPRKKTGLKEGTRLVIVAALRKGESCEDLAAKYAVHGATVGGIRAIKANLTRGAYD